MDVSTRKCLAEAADELGTGDATGIVFLPRRICIETPKSIHLLETHLSWWVQRVWGFLAHADDQFQAGAGAFLQPGLISTRASGLRLRTYLAAQSAVVTEEAGWLCREAALPLQP